MAAERIVNALFGAIIGGLVHYGAYGPAVFLFVCLLFNALDDLR